MTVCLSIAGSDSGGGAGIQADLKAFARCGVHGTTAITAITAQNTVGVDKVEAISADTIVAQIRAVASDFIVSAVKIGMVGNADTIGVVARVLDEFFDDKPVVLDPVMIAESGSRLLEIGAEAAMRDLLLPRATVVTPNLSEARLLASASKDADGEELAMAVHALGPQAALVTGGHRKTATDLLFDGQQLFEIPGERHPDGAAHGSGCTHSSALAAQLALGDDLLTAARKARVVAGEAVRDGIRSIGKGAGPVNALAAVTDAAPPVRSVAN